MVHQQRNCKKRTILNTNDTVNSLINLFTIREIDYKDAEVLYAAISLIHKLEDENVILKGRIDGHSCLPGNH
jgi:hypothetical protein